MKNSIAFFVTGDIGCTKELIPVAGEFRKRGCAVRWLVDHAGRGAETLAKAGIEFASPARPEGHPTVVVCGTSGTANGLQLAWTRSARERGIPVAWVEDLHGTGERAATHGTDPDLICAIDDAAAAICRRVRPKTQVTVCGKPSFEALHDLVADRETMRASVRNLLGLEERETLLTFWSGGEDPDRARTHLAAIVESPSIADCATRLAVRLHPKLPEDAKRRFREHLGGLAAVVEHTELIDANELTVASDVTIGDWGSTQCLVSTLAGVPTLVTLFPDDREKREGVGYPDGIPPLVMVDPSVGVRSPRELADGLRRILESPDDARELTLGRRRRPFLDLLAPGAAVSIADAILGCVVVTRERQWDLPHDHRATD